MARTADFDHALTVRWRLRSGSDADGHGTPSAVSLDEFLGSPGADGPPLGRGAGRPN